MGSGYDSFNYSPRITKKMILKSIKWLATFVLLAGTFFGTLMYINSLRSDADDSRCSVVQPCPK